MLNMMPENSAKIVLASPTEQKVAILLSKAAKVTLTTDDIQDWMSGGAGYDRTDAAVKKVLGNALYDKASDLVPFVLFEKLGLSNMVPGNYKAKVKEILGA